jgi:hypothetical protein
MGGEKAHCRNCCVATFSAGAVSALLSSMHKQRRSASRNSIPSTVRPSGLRSWRSLELGPWWQYEQRKKMRPGERMERDLHEKER